MRHQPKGDVVAFGPCEQGRSHAFDRAVEVAALTDDVPSAALPTLPWVVAAPAFERPLGDLDAGAARAGLVGVAYHAADDRRAWITRVTRVTCCECGCIARSAAPSDRSSSGSPLRVP